MRRIRRLLQDDQLERGVDFFNSKVMVAHVQS
jgi:hypothetical protein